MNLNWPIFFNMRNLATTTYSMSWSIQLIAGTNGFDPSTSSGFGFHRVKWFGWLNLLGGWQTLGDNNNLSIGSYNFCMFDKFKKHNIYSTIFWYVRFGISGRVWRPFQPDSFPEFMPISSQTETSHARPHNDPSSKLSSLFEIWWGTQI